MIDLRAENAALCKQLAAARAAAQALTARLAKDSHASSEPPSSDRLKRRLPRTRNLRRVASAQVGACAISARRSRLSLSQTWYMNMNQCSPYHGRIHHLQRWPSTHSSRQE